MEAPLVDPAEIRRLFLEILALPDDARRPFLHHLPLETRDELEALLDSDRGAETLLQSIVDGGHIPVATAGERFGPFQATKLLGRGGMGAVYKGERVDGELSQTVAIKVVEGGWLDPRVFERFRQERQFLAGLLHPGIARLMDGGTREDGVPYLVMEYVEGVPIDQFCEQHALDASARLRLLLPLCDAVDSAHHKLVIHRDLKPSNILVTEAGEPKLLDFGIAKALSAGASTKTQTISLTPDFASPEQARGEQASTADDIYGLGAVLHVLLLGCPPHGAPQKPEPSGDLRNILRKSLHDDPARRYRSARELSDDIGRYLTHRPVLATPDSAGYRAGRFVRRHMFACAAVALAVVAMIAGTAFSIYEARREQRRFAQVRDLANRFVFDFESAIRDTPGTLAARRMVASTAREYLGQLSRDVGSDPPLRRELAESYARLARVEMSAGENDAYLRDLTTSMELHKSLKDDCCGPPAARLQYITAVTDLARLNDDKRSAEQARELAAEGAENARAWYARSPEEALAGRAMVMALSTEGNVLLNRGQPREASTDLEQATRLGERLLLHGSSDDEMGYDRARAGHWYASSLASLGDVAAARVEEQKARAVLDDMLSRHPDNFRWRNLRVRMATSEAGFLRTLSQTDPSVEPLVLAAAREAYQMALETSRRNPGDRDLLDTAFVMTQRLGNEASREHHDDQAVPIFNEAQGFVEELLRSDPGDARYRYLLGVNRTSVGRLLMNLGRWADAVPVLDQAEQAIGQVLSRRPSDLPALSVKATILMNQAIDYRHLRKLDAARARCRLALDAADVYISKNRDAKTPFSDLEELRKEARTLGITPSSPSR